jgi:GH15 family glucan-1,4-alpha-glucosidase
MTSLDLGVIGNSNVAALIDRGGRIVWTSWPRIDGDPVFCSLLDGETPEDGYFSLEFDEETLATEQSYERNTAILRTVHRSASGAAFAVTDFSPRLPIRPHASAAHDHPPGRPAGRAVPHPRPHSPAHGLRQVQGRADRREQPYPLRL